jgi:hypothetical protein
MLELKPVQLSPSEPTEFKFEVEAKGLGRFVIDVSLPRVRPPGATFPVIMALDGTGWIDPLRGILHDVGLGATIAPPSMIVCVGHPPDEGMASAYARRHFEMHGPWEMTDPLGRGLIANLEALKALEKRPDIQLKAGGAERFSEFLRDELFPALAARFPVDPKGRHTLMGGSSGGHYVLRSLYDDRAPFRRYVCLSPGFGSNRGAIEALEAAYAARHDDMDVDLYISCTRVEIDQAPIMALCRFGSGVLWVVEQFTIRGWKNARVTWEIMNDEDHSSALPRGINTGLRAVHGTRPHVGKSIYDIPKWLQGAMPDAKEMAAKITDALSPDGSD